MKMISKRFLHLLYWNHMIIFNKFKIIWRHFVKTFKFFLHACILYFSPSRKMLSNNSRAILRSNRFGLQWNDIRVVSKLRPWVKSPAVVEGTISCKDLITTLFTSTSCVLWLFVSDKFIFFFNSIKFFFAYLYIKLERTKYNCWFWSPTEGLKLKTRTMTSLREPSESEAKSNNSVFKTRAAIKFEVKVWPHYK